MSLKTKLLAVGTAITSAAVSVQAWAVSYFPDTSAAAMTTDITDTNTALMAWVWTIFPIIALGWFAFNNSRKGAKKFGAG